MNTVGSGLILGLVSGIMTGSFSLPMKKTVRWSWEATWLVWSLCALLVIPVGIALATVPNVSAVFGGSDGGDIARVILFGAGWGLGAVFFGQSIAMIGVSLSFALCIGLATALGMLIPMLKDVAVFTTQGGKITTLGIIVMGIGVIVCALAGRQKEKQLKGAEGASSGGSSGGRMMLGLALAALGGTLSSLLNIAFNYSGSIIQAAVDAGATATSKADWVWAMTLLGGLITNVAYCSVLLTRNKTWSDYRKPATGSHWFLAALMGAIWMPSIALYGRAAFMMGDLGPSAGWGLYMGVVIAISNVWGFVTGEWKGAHGKPVKVMMMGSALILLAIMIMGYGIYVKEAV